MRYIFLFAVLLATVCARPEVERRANRPVNPDEVGPYYQGDIMLTPEQKNGILDPARHWVDGIVYYEFDSTITDEYRNLIFLAQSNFTEATDGCLTFVERADESNYVFYTSIGEGCFSFVGSVGGSQQMNLPDWCINRFGSLMHEHLHAYGFYHEQSRFDRDDYVTINFDNIQSGAENNFDIQPVEVADGWGEEYNYLSVLHYSEGAFAVDPFVPTIVTVDPAFQDLIGQREEVTVSDWNKLKRMYGCPL